MTKPKAQTLGPSGPGALAQWDGEIVGAIPLLSAVPNVRDQLAGTPLAETQPACPQCAGYAAFDGWLHQRLASYRQAQAAQASVAQLAAVIGWLQWAAHNIDRAIADGRLRRPPAWFAEPALGHAAFEIGRDWRKLVASGDRSAILHCLRVAGADLQAQSRKHSTRGRRRATPRDALLAAIKEHLRAAGLSAIEAEHRANTIVVKCGAASAGDSIGRAARRGRKRGAISA
jgi:hypothetical protein